MKMHQKPKFGQLAQRDSGYLPIHPGGPGIGLDLMVRSKQTILISSDYIYVAALQLARIGGSARRGDKSHRNRRWQYIFHGPVPRPALRAADGPSLTVLFDHPDARIGFCEALDRLDSAVRGCVVDDDELKITELLQQH